VYWGLSLYRDSTDVVADYVNCLYHLRKVCRIVSKLFLCCLLQVLLTLFLHHYVQNSLSVSLVYHLMLECVQVFVGTFSGALVQFQPDAVFMPSVSYVGLSWNLICIGQLRVQLVKHFFR